MYEHVATNKADVVVCEGVSNGDKLVCLHALQNSGVAYTDILNLKA